MSDWSEWMTNGRTFKDLIHPAGGISEEAYTESSVSESMELRKVLNGKSLEYGCGNGRILRHLQDLDIYGVDLVQEFIDDGKKLGLKNLYTLAELDEKFDTIYSKIVFIHLNDTQTFEALKWIKAHLNDNGTAYLQIPIYDKATPHNGNFMNVRTWDLDSLVGMLFKCGLELQDYKISDGVFDYENIGEYHYYCHKITIKS